MNMNVLENNWTSKTLRDLATINYGKSPKDILAEGGLYPVVGTGGTERYGNAYLYDGESIVLGRKGTIDRVYFATGRFWTIDTAYYLSNFNDAQPRWLFYYLQNLDLRQLNEATGVPSLSRDLLYKIKIATPPQPEQSKIAELLSTVDQVIEQTEALIAKQQRIKTGLMHDLLTRGIDEHGNLRSEETHEFKDSPLGRIPVEWEIRTIDELAIHVGSGITPKGGRSVYTPEGVLFIRSQNVHFGGLKLHDVAYIPMHMHRKMRRSAVYENDILLNITGASIGRCCRMPKINGKANVNQHVCAIRLRDVSESKSEFLASILESYVGQNQIAQFNAGGNREGLNYQQVRSFVLPWPSDHDEFDRIYKVIMAISREISVARKHQGKLLSLKTALMQDLLTGKVRVTPLLEANDKE